MQIKTEDDWIQFLKKSAASPSEKGVGRISIGDDAAIYNPSPGKQQVICSDSLVEGVHFDLKKISWEDLGWKSLAVNLSDVAAMGATPTSSLLNLSLPKKYMGEPLKRFLKGYLSLSHKHEVALIGGDTTASLRDLFISVTVVGEVSSKNLKLRAQAKPKDVICVTGFLGDSYAGFLLQSQIWKSPSKGKLLKAHHKPLPQVELGKWLGTQSGVHAMMDLSDGLMKDLSRLCESSKVSAVVNGSEIPTSPSLIRYAKHFKKSPIYFAVRGGEDYQLLLTCSPSQVEKLVLHAKKKFCQRVTPIGEIQHQNSKLEAIEWKDLPKNVLAHESFEHF